MGPEEPLTRPALCLMTSLAKETSVPAFLPLRRGLWGEGEAIAAQQTILEVPLRIACWI